MLCFHGFSSSETATQERDTLHAGRLNSGTKCLLSGAKWCFLGVKWCFLGVGGFVPRGTFWGTLACVWATLRHKVLCMPMSELQEMPRKSLVRREAKDSIRWKVLRSGEASRAAFRCRDISLAMHRLAKDESLPIQDRIAACKAMLAAQDQLADWLGHPKRPAGRDSSRPAIPIEAVEAILAPIPADLPQDLSVD